MVVIQQEKIGLKFGVQMNNKALLFSILIIIVGCAERWKLGEKQSLATQKTENDFHPTAVQHFIRGSIDELRGDYKTAYIEYSQALLFD